MIVLFKELKLNKDYLFSLSLKKALVTSAFFAFLTSDRFFYATGRLSGELIFYIAIGSLKKERPVKLVKTFLLLILFVMPSLEVRAENYPPYKIKINWDNPGTLKDSVVQVCDDTYYPYVEIEIPGKSNKDFRVEMGVDITEGRLSSGCSIKKQTNKNSVLYKFDAFEGGCTIKVYKVRKQLGEPQKSAIYDIFDAC